MDFIKEFSQPTIKKPSIEIDNIDSRDSVRIEYKSGQSSPMIFFGGIYYMDADVMSFKLSYGDTLLPSVKVTLFDKASVINADNFDTTDSETFDVYIRANVNDYLPVSATFLVTSLRKEGNNKYVLKGNLFVPSFNTEFIKHYDGSSFDVCKKIAEELGLGFGANVDSSDDEQVWMRLAKSAEDFLEEVRDHAWVNDKSSVRVWIDPYYVLNYFDIGEAYATDKTEFDKVGTANKTPSLDADKESKLQELVFTNDPIKNGTEMFIQSYSPFDRRGLIERQIGFDRVFRTEDLDRDEYFEYNVQQIILETTIQRVGDNSRNSYIGFTTDNTHRNYNHAVVQNEIMSMFYGAVGIRFNVTPMNLTAYNGMIIPVMLKNTDNINTDLKGANENAFYNENVSAFYVISRMTFEFANNAMSTAIEAIKIRDDIKA